MIEKRKVTMTNAVAEANGTVSIHKAEDYVPLEILEAYVADAKKRWQAVVVDHEAGHDPGPGGDDGETHYPVHLTDPNHPDYPL
jgi:hypothetical protein